MTWDLVICLLYSFIIIISALVRYVFQCKNLNLVFGGKVCLTLYFTFHLISRLTMVIALFCTAEALDINRPMIPLYAMAGIYLFICISHFGVIYFFKMKWVKNFDKIGHLERFVHVLVNTVVVVPFSWWDAKSPYGLGVKKAENVNRSFSFHNHTATKTSMNPLKSSLSEAALKLSRNNFLDVIKEIGNVREELEKLWWEDPNRLLAKDLVMKEFKKKNILKNVSEETIEAQLKDLQTDGFINKKLYNPQKTKREYFYLLIFQLMASSGALIVEWINGGTFTCSGMYYSWDVSLSTFVLGIVFLLLYYKKYHVLRDLTSSSNCCSCQELLPVFFGLKQQEPLTAVPIDEELIGHFRCQGTHKTTQTSIISEKRKPLEEPQPKEINPSH